MSEPESHSGSIARNAPTLILFLIDQSESMSRPMSGANSETGRQTSKAQCVADCINRLIYDLVDRNTDHGVVIDRVMLGVVGYGSQVRNALTGTLHDAICHPLSKVGKNPLRIDRREIQGTDLYDQPTVEIEEIPIWVDPISSGKTKMLEALRLARDQVQRFLSAMNQALPGVALFPPIVVQITDGHATDGTPAEVEAAAQAIRELSTLKGNVLLFNIHLAEPGQAKVVFPADQTSLPNDLARFLFRTASVLPNSMRTLAAANLGLSIPNQGRCYVYNSDLPSLTAFLDFSTRVK